ncbi:hypothetical protein D9756_011600 [Leucocoprinus leucothites]|uniref:DNA 3'-5' helicase n=1 Tax=Leucocoprinus leucothites TaxID=201217 RepID=A0A8H5CM73_9AGAR|nr:hypothetical protein D9756_011600 [Leucoagaricus leucothites]
MSTANKNPRKHAGSSDAQQDEKTNKKIIFQCCHCHKTIEVETQNQRNVHVAGCRPKTVTVGGKEYAVHRDEGGYYHCKCTGDCKGKYASFQTIVNHLVVPGVGWKDNGEGAEKDRPIAGLRHIGIDDTDEEKVELMEGDSAEIRSGVKMIIQEIQPQVFSDEDGGKKGENKIESIIPESNLMKRRGAKKKQEHRIGLDQVSKNFVNTLVTKPSKDEGPYKKIQAEGEPTKKRVVKEVNEHSSSGKNPDTTKALEVSTNNTNSLAPTREKTPKWISQGSAEPKPGASAEKSARQKNSGLPAEVTSQNSRADTPGVQMGSAPAEKDPEERSTDISTPEKLKLSPKNHKSSFSPYIGRDLIPKPKLLPFCLYFQETLKLLICPTCSVALTPDIALDHVRNLHEESGLKGKKIKEPYMEVCKELQLAGNYPDWEKLYGGPALGGLMLYESALLCDHGRCQQIHSTAAAMKTHHQKVHSTKPVPKSWPMVAAQRLNNGDQNSLFRVKALDTYAGSHKDSWDTWLDELDDQIKSIVRPVNLNNPDPRNVNAWLKTTGWAEHAGGHSSAFLFSLVAAPAKNEFPKLREAIDYIFSKAMHFLNDTPPMILRKLNTSDSKSAISHYPFRKLQTSGSLSNYANILSRLVSFLIRPKGDYVLPLPDHIQELAENIGKMKPRSGIDPASPDADFVQYAKLIVNLLISVWTRLWDPSNENSIGDPTMCFVALSSIDGSGTWMHPKLVTPTIASLFFSIRSIFLFHIHNTTTLGESVRRRFALIEIWKDESKESTWSELCSLQHLATAYARSQPSLPRYIWLDDQNTRCLWKGHEITLFQLQNMARELLRLQYKSFVEDVMLGFNIRLDYKRIWDDLSDDAPHYGFVEDSANAELDQHNLLMQCIRNDPRRRKEFLVGTLPDGKPLWNPTRVRQWLAAYAEFLLLLMASIEVTAGSPSRGTEMTCIHIRNTPTRTRGLYVLGDHVAIVCQYTKTSNLTSQDSLLPHGLDAFNSDFIAHVVFVTHPFAQRLISFLYPNNPEFVKLYHTHLFVNVTKEFGTEDLTRILKSVTLSTLKVSMGLSDYRQTSIAFRRVHCSRFEKLMQMDDEDTPGALQAGHSRATENMHYGRNASFLGNVADDIAMPLVVASTDWQTILRIPKGGQVLPYTLLETEDRWCKYISPEISPFLRPDKLNSTRKEKNGTHHTPGGSAFPSTLPSPNQPQIQNMQLPPRNTQSSTAEFGASKSDSEKCDMPEEDFGVSHLDLSGNRSNYAPTINVSPLPQSNTVPDHPNATDRWMDNSEDSGSSINLYWSKDEVMEEANRNDAQGAKSGGNENRADGHVGPGNIVINDYESNLNEKALMALRKLLKDPSANWVSPHQKNAVLAAVRRQNDVVVSLPTGSGKTMIPAIPAYLNKTRTTCIIVPFISLLDDYSRRLLSWGISFVLFDGIMSKFPENCSVVLSTVEMAITESFRSCVFLAHRSAKLQALFIDEVHEIHAAKDYRPAMKTAQMLRSAGCPIVLMSATIPPPMEPHLIDTLNLIPDNLTVVRASSNRPELEYIIAERVQTDSAHKELLLGIINNEQALSTSLDDRGLVFVSDRAQGYSAAKDLNCGFYHAQLNKNQRQEVVTKWTSGTNRVMVCTTAYSAGNDYPHVRYVIWYGTPFDMITTIQAMGRAGRDGDSARCYIIPLDKIGPKQVEEDPLDLIGRQAMYDLLWNSNECIRLSLTRFNDGNGVSCDDSKNIKCSFCKDGTFRNPLKKQCIQKFPLPPSAENGRPAPKYTSSSSKTILLPAPCNKPPPHQRQLQTQVVESYFFQGDEAGEVLVPSTSQLSRYPLSSKSSHHPSSSNSSHYPPSPKSLHYSLLPEEVLVPSTSQLLQYPLSSKSSHYSPSSSSSHYPPSLKSSHYPSSPKSSHYPASSNSSHYPPSPGSSHHPSSPKSSHYPASSNSSHYPASSNSSHYPASSNSSHYPTSSNSSHYPASSNSSHYPASSNSSHYPASSNSSHYPASSNSSHYPASSNSSYYPPSSNSSHYPSSSKSLHYPSESNFSSAGKGKRPASDVFHEKAREVKLRKVQKDLADERYASRLRSALRMLENICSACLVSQSDGTVTGHKANGCDILKGPEFTAFRTWRRKVSLKYNIHGDYCTCCWMPQMKEAVHPNIPPGTKAADTCPYPDLIPPLLYLVYHTARWCEMAQGHFKTTWDTDTHYAKWLSGPPVLGHRSNIAAVMLWYVEDIWEKQPSGDLSDDG